MNPIRLRMLAVPTMLPTGLAVVLLLMAGCRGRDGEIARAGEASRPATVGAPEGHEQEAGEHAGHEAEEVDAEHAHGGTEVSDLDRPLADLMSDRCEHAMLTYKCDECRYETGMVKVAPDLMDEDGPLHTARVVRRATEESVAHNGEVRLNEERSAWLSPRTGGAVRSILVDLGAHVRQGQVLFTVDSPEFAEARSAYLIAQSSLKLAEGTLARERDLYEKKVCPRKDLLEAEAARDEAAATLQAARERLMANGLTAQEIAGLPTDGAQAAAMPVRAPFDGTILERHLSIGALVEPGQNLLLLGDTAKMWVWTSLYERELAAVLLDQKRGTIQAHVEIPAYPGRIFTGRLEQMNGIVDETTRTAQVRVVVDNEEGLLRAGMFARVHLHDKRSAQTLTVPAEAVLDDEGRSFVFVPAEPPYFVRRPVMVGRAWGEWVEVTQGLEENDVVVSRGAFALKSDVLRSKMGAGCAD